MAKATIKTVGDVGLKLLIGLLFVCIGIEGVANGSGNDLYRAIGDDTINIILGIVLIDIGMQCIQLSNQSTAFSLNPKASSRINSLFMTCYFLGGASGTFIAGTAWQYGGWNGVCVAGAALALIVLLITLRARR